MKLKIITGIIIFLSISLSVLLFIEEEEVIKIIVSPKIYSIMKSSDTEKIKITVLVNDSNSYYFNKEYISNINLSSTNDDLIPLIVDNIDKSNDYYPYKNDIYYYITFNLDVAFQSDYYHIELKEAYLNISYSNAKEIKLFIGEFNYHFNEFENVDFSINNLLCTHAEVNGIDTTTGLFLSLGNLTNNNITINSIDLGTKNVFANNFYLREVFSEVSLSSFPNNILNIDYYDFDKYSDYETSILLRKNNEIMLYVPFSYIGEIPYLHRFYIKVNYTINSNEEVFILDDFPYINTSNYKIELEGDYVYYEFEN